MRGLEWTTVRGRSIAYRRAGAGRALVLLHGFAADSRLWQPQLDALGHDFDVIAWDAIGAGASDDPPEAYGLADWAADLVAFLDALGVERADVLGLSWGGLLAQEVDRIAPGRVRSLILADTYAGWRGSLGVEVAEQRLAAARLDAELPSEAFARQYLASMFGGAPKPEALTTLEAVLRDVHPHGFRLMAEALADADTRDLLPTIQVPTLLLWGDQDTRSPLNVGAAFHRAIPGSRLVIIPGAGHVANLDRPAEFNVAVRDFLEP